MKIIVILYLLSFLAILVPRTLSSPNQQHRLYHLLRKSPHTSADSLTLPIPDNKDASELAAGSDLKEETKNIQTRYNWDSGEHYYYEWANKNRRPIEYFGARRRDTDVMMVPPRARRINGGLWSSGLIGK
ncbi:unnamed protein product [Adineta ricciae]|uniref:Uncharacterized protein n=1 Tax=Adineta ricciae TaxID=249248 RepID=A0A813XNM5_ADIRI|nr:unnamed protein product [Adineta ricciae]CAF0921780.1 unnamed protein product [Adineta ricciae]